MIRKIAINKKQGTLPIETVPFTKDHGLETSAMAMVEWIGAMERATWGLGSLAMQAETGPSSTV